MLNRLDNLLTKPLVIDGKGKSKDIRFRVGAQTEAHASCSIIWHGDMFIFGGYDNRRQISQVDGCKLTRVGQLPFKMRYGACAQRENEEIFYLLRKLL